MKEADKWYLIFLVCWAIGFTILLFTSVGCGETILSLSKSKLSFWGDASLTNITTYQYTAESVQLDSRLLPGMHYRWIPDTRICVEVEFPPPRPSKPAEKIAPSLKKMISEFGVSKRYDVIIQYYDPARIEEIERRYGLVLRSISCSQRYRGGWVSGDQIMQLAKEENVRAIWPGLQLTGWPPSGVFIDALDPWTKTVGEHIALAKVREALGIDQLKETGRGVIIIISDTGIADHPDITARINKAVTIRMDPCGGHGTHVAGIAAANGKIRGIAPEAEVWDLPIICYNSSAEQLNALVEVSAAATALGKPVVLNMSWGALAEEMKLPESPLAHVVRCLDEMDVVMVAASGNCGGWNSRDECVSKTCFGFRGVAAPAVFPEVISVGAYNIGGKSSLPEICGNMVGTICSFSSWENPTIYGESKPDVVAPGCFGIESLGPGGEYLGMSGTSQAAPAISGLAALLLEAHPEASNGQIEEALKKSASLRGLAAEKAGCGIPVAAKALEILDAGIYSPEDQSRLPLSVEALVYDKQTGDRICHAEVRLKGEGIDVEKRLTEKKCVAKFDDVKIKPGIYTLQVEAEGYNPVTRTDHLEEGTYRYTVKLAPEKAKWLIQTLKNPVFWIVLIGILLVIALAIRIYHYRIMG